MNFPGRKTLLPLAACTIVVLAWFSPWWIGGKFLAPLDLQNRMMSPWRSTDETEFAKNHIVADGVDQYLVYRMIAARDFRKEGEVGWSSLTYGGTAQHANTMALYDDWSMQLHRWFDFGTAWHLGLIGQFLIAAWGMVLFLRGRRMDAIWCFCGGVAYAANSQFITWIYHRWMLGAFCWVPWILWSIDGYRSGRRGFWTMVPLFTALAFLGGTLQHAALVILAVAAMWLEETLQHRPASGPGSAARIFGRYVVWGILGCGLAGMMFFPCADAFLTSNRLGLHTGMHGNAENGVYPQGWLQPLFNLAAYPLQMFPSILGRCDSVDVLKLFKSELFYVCYFGSLPVLVAMLSIFRKHTPLLARILLVAGWLLPLTPLVRVLYQRLFLLFIIGGILAFVSLMQDSNRTIRMRISRITAALVALASCIWLGGSLLLLAKPSWIDAIRTKIIEQGKGSSFGFHEAWLASRAARFTGDLFIWSPQQLLPLLLLAVSLAGLWMTSALSVTTRRAGAWIIAFAVLAEVSLFGARWTTWSDLSSTPLFAETAESRILKQEVGSAGRVTTLIHPIAHMAKTPFIPNTLAAYGLATISGYDSIVPDGMLLPNETPGDAARLGKLGVTHLVTWPDNPEVPASWKKIWQSPAMELYANPLAVPRYIAFSSDASKESFFKNVEADYHEIHETLGLENKRRLTIPRGTRWVRIAENSAPGWAYQIGNESWQPTARGPDGSMLLRIPLTDRDSHISMRYRPPLRRMGWFVAATSLAALLLLHVILTRGRPPSPSTFS